MTTYRLFPSTNGPSTPVNYTPGSAFISGACFTVNGGGNWFEGYWWWVSPDTAADGFQNTTPTKCALWTVAFGGGHAALVPGSVVTSGTLTAGQWNYIPLAEPVQLAPGYDASNSTWGSVYIAAVGCNGPFPDTNGFWGTGGPGAGGIINGPLVAYSGPSGNGGTLPAPYTTPQGSFSTGGTDPSVSMPDQQSTVDNFWVDVQVSDTAPAGYSGSYRLYPNKADANDTVTSDAAVNYTIATEIHLSQECTLNNIWYFVPVSATTLATRCDVWDISTGLSVASITSPAWKDATGATFTNGEGAGSIGAWARSAFTANTTLPAGRYRVSVYNANGISDGNWSSKDAFSDYWGQTNQGAGANGITWGPLYAPSQPNASSGWQYGGPGTATPPYSDGTAQNAQPVFGQMPDGSITFPQLYAPVNGGSGPNIYSQNYWVDLEVTPPAGVPVSDADTGRAIDSQLFPNAQAVSDADACTGVEVEEHVSEEYSPLLQPLTWAPPGDGYHRALPHRPEIWERSLIRPNRGNPCGWSSGPS